MLRCMWATRRRHSLDLFAYPCWFQRFPQTEARWKDDTGLWERIKGLNISRLSCLYLLPLVVCTSVFSRLVHTVCRLTTSEHKLCNPLPHGGRGVRRGHTFGFRAACVSVLRMSALIYFVTLNNCTVVWQTERCHGAWAISRHPVRKVQRFHVVAPGLWTVL